MNDCNCRASYHTPPQPSTAIAWVESQPKPSIPNVFDVSERDLLWAYKKQPAIETIHADENRLFGGSYALAVGQSD